jgi:sulfhydrogenase subunit delta
MVKPKIGIFSLTGCGGDQLMILNLEPVLLELLSNFEIIDFQEGSSYHEDTALDIAFVEGSVSTKSDLNKLKDIRMKSKMLIALGDCAIGGCVQAMRNGQLGMKDKMKKVYGVKEDYYDAIEAKGLGDYIKVDFEISGCPIEKEEILRSVTSLLHGDKPELPDYPVCVECKLNGYLCLLVEKGLPCLGPIIRAGCEARCPGLGLDCIGCRGPIDNETNAAAEFKILLDSGFSKEDIINRLRFFGGNFEEIQNLNMKISEKKGI